MILTYTRRSTTPTDRTPTMPDPYWTDGHRTIYLGRSEDILPALPSDSVHLIVTDPPYGQQYDSKKSQQHGMIEGDDETASVVVPSVLSEACRLLRRGRHAYVFGPPR